MDRLPGSLTRSARRRALLLLSSTALASLLAAPALSRADQTFMGVINGPQEEPPVLDSNAQGVVFATFDPGSRMLCYSISYSELSSTEIAAHFHGPGEPGVNAGVIFNISPDPSPFGSPKVGCVGPFTSTQARDLRDGLVYFNVHTTEHPAGEIRGQLVRVGQTGTAVTPGRLPFRP